MVKYRTSIRQKIIVGYYAAVAVMIGMAVFTFMTLMFLEKKIVFSTVITELFDTTLEIRRFEKNFILYGQTEDYQENLRYVAKAKEIFEANIEEYENLAVTRQLYTMRDGLNTYRSLMEQFASLDKKPTPKVGCGKSDQGKR